MDKEKFIDMFAEMFFGRTRTEAMKQGICVTCGKKIDMEDFRDEKSRKEYEITGMCQECQDEVFDYFDEEEE